MHLSVCENYMKVIRQIMCLICICLFTLYNINVFSSLL